jgi:ribosomal protein S18 acetylase RimI-like enzyme
MEKTLVALEKVHDVKGFDCDIPGLNHWLHTTAMQHQKNGMSKTFVYLDEADSKKILGFVALAIRTLTPSAELPAEMRRKLPHEVPGFTLARLAVSKEARHNGIGEFLLLDAMERTFRAAQNVGGFALFVDAKDGAAGFYAKYGFQPLPGDPDTLVMPIASMPKFL